ncbi:MAG TPA: hypothetical protein VGK70_09320 [Thermoanaerobaculia bacterium]|jgi:hypothetical protein
MNREFVLFNLREALEELERTIKEIETDPEYEEGDFMPAMTHLYHHVNTAWNARDASQEKAEAGNEEDFVAWNQFPAG